MACEFSLQQLVEATGGQILSTVEKNFFGVGTDSRQNLDKKIFIALEGDNFDAHEFLAQAQEAGAKCLLVHLENSQTESLKGKVTIVKTKNTLRALQDLALYWRRKVPARVFGVTGSNGKTTTKEFAAAIMATQFKVHYSKGSYNNHWGVPLTLLGISMFTEVAIVEMGMNHAGEITQLSKIARPDVVICTTVGQAHIGNFNGSQQAIADAKEEIYLANPKAVKIFNYDNEYTIKMFDRISQLTGTEKTVAFSAFSAGSEVSFRAHQMSLTGLHIVGHIAGVKGEAQVPVFGRHNVHNLMAAVCMALVMKMEPERIWAAMTECKSEWGRNQLIKLNNGTQVLFDAYNANPDSMNYLIKNLFEIPIVESGKKVAVLGDMLELGDDSARLHEELGEMLGQTDIAVIWFLGTQARHFERGIKRSGYNKTLIISDVYEESLAIKLRSMLNPSDVVVIKGSRGMKLERVMFAWDPQFATYKA